MQLNKTVHSAFGEIPIEQKLSRFSVTGFRKEFSSSLLNTILNKYRQKCRLKEKFIINGFQFQI